MGNMGFFSQKIWDKYGIFLDFPTKIWDIYGKIHIETGNATANRRIQTGQTRYSGSNTTTVD